MFARYASAMSTGIFMTLGLIYVMQALIGMQPMTVFESTPRGTLDFIRIQAPEELRTDKYEPPPIEEFTNVDPTPARPELTGDPIEVGVIMPNQKSPGGGKPVLNPGTLQDGEAFSVVLVQPTYPTSQLAKGIEGFVVVEFDVLESGKVANPRVIESSSSAFHRSALQAALKMKFKPRVVDGVPLVTYGLRNKFTYKIEH